MLSNVTFQQGSGGLGRPLAGQDFVSGLIFYSAALPSGFNSANRMQKFLSPVDAVNAGISYSYADETQATGTYLVTATGTNSDVITIQVKEPNGNIVTLGSYTKASTETTVNAVANKMGAAINANTQATGYSAITGAGTINIKARLGLGIFLNSGSPIVVTSPGAIAGTLTQFSGGIASRNAVYYYHISEFFRIQPQGVLYVGIFPVPTTYTFNEITTLQSFAVGTIRQWAVWKDASAFSTADLTAMDLVNKTLDVAHAPLIGLYGGDLSGTTDISTLTDLSVLTANTAAAVIAQDGGAQGLLLFQTFGKSITNLGAALGAVALANVNEDIGWLSKFNMSNGTECETLAFANGVLFSDPSISNNLLTTLDNYRYLFLLKYIGFSGSYFCHFNMAVSVSSDYAYGQDNRTIQKAKRGIYVSLLPVLNGPLILNSNGTLANTTIAYLITLAEAALIIMVRAGEISANGVIIDPTQNVSSTGTVTINVQLVEDGTARQIIVPIGYTQSLTS